MKYSKSVELTVGNVWQALGQFKKVTYAAGELGVGVRDLKRFMRRNGMDAQESVKLYETAFASLSKSFDENASKFMSSAIPSSQKEKFKTADKYASEDDLVGDLVLMSSDLSIKGINVRLGGTQTRINKIKRFKKNYDMLGLSAQMFESAFRYSNIVPLVKRVGNTVLYIKILEPERLTVIRNGGVINGVPQKQVLYELPEYILDAVRKKNLKGIDPKWVLAAQGGAGVRRGFVEFKESDGEFVYIMNRKGVRDALVDPEMSRAFPHIKLRKLKWDGEFSVDFHIKNLLHQVIVDKAKAKSTPFKTIVQAATQTELNALLKKYTGDESKAMVEVTTPEITHEYHGPEPAKYAPVTKFDNVDKVIERNFGFSRILTSGEGGSYSGGYIFTKQLIARIERWRKVVAEFWEMLYKSIISSDEGISIAFDPNALKEAAQILKEQEFALSNGVASAISIGEQMGYDDDFEVMRKRKTRENIDDYTPVFEKSQGIVAEERGVDDDSGTPGAPGSPGTDGPQSKLETDPPRP